MLGWLSDSSSGKPFFDFAGPASAFLPLHPALCLAHSLSQGGKSVASIHPEQRPHLINLCAASTGQLWRGHLGLTAAWLNHENGALGGQGLQLPSAPPRTGMGIRSSLCPSSPGPWVAAPTSIFQPARPGRDEALLAIRGFPCHESGRETACFPRRKWNFVGRQG